jgi:hypothetical protein
MTLVNPEKLFAKFKPNPPASSDSVAQCQSRLSFRLPADYVQFLKRMNGGEGFVGRNYLMAWPVEGLIQFNKELFVHVAAPVLFLFGSSGGGEEFAFDTRSSPPLIVAVPSIVYFEDAITIAQDFNSFLQHLYQSDNLLNSQREKLRRGPVCQ